MFMKLYKYYLILLLPLTINAGGNIHNLPKEEITKDTIVVHNMTLYGKIVKIGSDKLSFRLQYSDGLSNFSYKDISSIKTNYNYHISYNRMDIIGKIIGIEDNKYLNIIEKNGDLRTVKIRSIDNFVMSTIDDDSFENIVRNKFPYTKGSVNVGFNLEHGTTEKRSVDIILDLKHKQAEHELSLLIDYEYETRETETKPKYDYTDELVGILTYKNHFKSNQFWYTTFMADYDRPRHINNRYAPSAGYGYRFQFEKHGWIEPSIGLGYVKTSYTDDKYTDKNFLATALILTAKYKMDNLLFIDRLITDGYIMSYPSLKNPSKDWLTRVNLNFTIPLFEFFSVKLALGYVNDSNPDPTVGNNKQTAKLLFGLDF